MRNGNRARAAVWMCAAAMAASLLGATSSHSRQIEPSRA